jgi:exodeoxyribonuclease VII small subunit
VPKQPSPHVKAALAELEQIASLLEQDNVVLAASLQSFELDSDLNHQCRKALQEANQNVPIPAQFNGTFTLEPYTNE